MSHLNQAGLADLGQGGGFRPVGVAGYRPL